MEVLKSKLEELDFYSKKHYNLYLFAVECANDLQKLLVESYNRLLIEECFVSDGAVFIDTDGIIYYSKNEGDSYALIEVKEVIGRYGDSLGFILVDCETKADILVKFDKVKVYVGKEKCITLSEYKKMQDGKKIITIHYDFTDGTEISYIEGLSKNSSFSTHCLNFFCFDTKADDVIVVRKDGRKLVRSKIQEYSNGKEIRLEHNLYRMLLANSFIWK